MTDQITNAINNLGEVITGEKINGSTIKDAINEISEKYVAPTPTPTPGGETLEVVVRCVTEGGVQYFVSDVTFEDIKNAILDGTRVYIAYECSDPDGSFIEVYHLSRCYDTKIEFTRFGIDAYYYDELLEGPWLMILEIDDENAWSIGKVAIREEK